MVAVLPERCFVLSHGCHFRQVEPSEDKVKAEYRKRKAMDDHEVVVNTMQLAMDYPLLLARVRVKEHDQLKKQRRYERAVRRAARRRWAAEEAQEEEQEPEAGAEEEPEADPEADPDLI